MSNVDRNNGVMSRSRLPLYLQLAAEFRRCLDSGAWPPSHQLPTLESLMDTYGVSRMTLRQALGVLESEGLISRARGKGTFVTPRSVAPRLEIPTTWQGAVALSDVLGTHSITESSQLIDGLPEHGMQCSATQAPRYRHLCRLHSANGQPFCFSEVYIEEALFRRHRQKFSNQAAASVIARIPGLEIDESRQKLSIIQAGFQSANALNLDPGESVAEVRRFASARGVVIYYARLEFPPQFVTLELDLLRGG